MSKPASANVEAASKILAGEPIDNKNLLDLAIALQQERAFGLARRILERNQQRITAPDTDKTLARKLTQLLSLSTYKDPDLNPLDKLDRALEILRSLDNLDLNAKSATKDQETLGQVGSIFKRKWELTNQSSYLETSLAYFAHGYKQGVANDFGYTGINAAFIEDILADLESNDSDRLAKIKHARKIREDIIAVVPTLTDPKQWWYPVTIAEAYFGLERYIEAGEWLKQAADLPNVAEWEWETTARQLARLLQLQNKHHTPAEARLVLEDFLGNRAAGLDALLKGKVGLALSGGGFRASLFHIGMLAKLAELDLLRNVEYLSCVSGGSIIGAHYYLEVRNLLQAKADANITREDYIAIVKRVEKDFLDGVQTNVRVQVLSEWLVNAKMIYSQDYSRTNRLGELYEEKIFSRVKPLTQSGESTAPAKLFINELKIQPQGEQEGFSPKEQNWRRAAKIPILVLNATPLNTGHNWQFTTTWMGEPPAGAGSQIDPNYRLRRLYYQDAPPAHQNVRLGDAVAASSCVPSLFEPLPLSELYPDKIVRLVDGGVHDNQGTAALLEQGCNVLLVSDASGQMDAQDDPSKGLLGVPLRANSILQARIRESQFRELDARKRSGLLQGLLFIHLRQGLESQPVDWLGCNDPSESTPDTPALPYGIQREVQKKLATVRTDLDSFSDAEAYALMTSAYRMTEYALNNPVNTLGFATKEASTQAWTFLEIEPELQKPGNDTPILRQLRVADRLFFRVWLLSKTLKTIGYGIAAAILWLLAYLSVQWWSVPLSTTWGHLLTGLFLIVLGTTLWKPVLQVFQYRKTIQEVLIGLGMVVVGSVLAKVHLKVFDKLFLSQGSLKAFGKK